MKVIESEEDLKSLTPELLKEMTKEFSFEEFYKLDGYKAAMVVTPKQVVIVLTPEMIESKDNNYSHIYHRSIISSIYKMMGIANIKEREISPLNISCLSTNYADFCFVELANNDNNIITPAMLEVVNKIRYIIWSHPKEVQYGDMRATKRIITKNASPEEEIIVGVPIEEFIKILEKQLTEIKSEPLSSKRM